MQAAWCHAGFHNGESERAGIRIRNRGISAVIAALRRALLQSHDVNAALHRVVTRNRERKTKREREGGKKHVLIHCNCTVGLLISPLMLGALSRDVVSDVEHGTFKEQTSRIMHDSREEGNRLVAVRRGKESWKIARILHRTVVSFSFFFFLNYTNKMSIKFCSRVVTTVTTTRQIEVKK